MKGDFTRFTFDSKKHYSAVRQQQGRVQLDADWNEQLDINQHRLATQMSDFIGYSGVPNEVEQADGSKADTSFKIRVDQDNKLKIGAGRIYVAGELYENEEEVDLTLQLDNPGAILSISQGTYVAYLDVWQRLITPLEDPDIGEVALGGVDTATRVKNIWQVKLIQEKSGDTYGPDWHPEGVEPISTGEMQAKVGVGAALENQLYRVEIHQGGDSSTATFKWSRDNGSVAAEVVSVVDKTITVSSAGRDPQMGFVVGQWVELRSETQTVRGEPGSLYYITRVQGNELTVDSTTPLPTIEEEEKWIVRRWDSQAGNSQEGVLQILNDWILLENDIKVKFQTDTGKIYKTGDYWLIPARKLSGKIEVPTETWLPPHGILHHYAALALLEYDDSNWSVKADGDLRAKFSPLIGGFIRRTGDTMSGPLTIEPSDGQSGLIVQGNVGIGTTTPGAPLEVEGTVKATKFQGDGSDLIGVNTKWKGDSNIYYEGGNVGIGTTAPKSKLSVSGGVGIGTTYADTNAAPEGCLIVQGNVGIGTTNPEVKLDVRGDIRFGPENEDRYSLYTTYKSTNFEATFDPSSQSSTNDNIIVVEISTSHLLLELKNYTITDKTKIIVHHFSIFFEEDNSVSIFLTTLNEIRMLHTANQIHFEFYEEFGEDFKYYSSFSLYDA